MLSRVSCRSSATFRVKGLVGCKAVLPEGIRCIGSSRTRSSTSQLTPADITQTVSAGSATLMSEPLALLPKGQKPKFISALSPKELTSFILLSSVTSSKYLIDLSAKALPYTPNSLVKQFVYPIYCGGETFPEVLETGRKLLNRGIGNMMLSYSVEDAEGNSPAASSALLANAVSEICNSIDEVLVPHYDIAKQAYDEEKSTVVPGQGFIALKPTGLMVGATDILRNFDQPAYADKWQQYLQICRKICQHAAEHGQGKVAVVFDAEKKVLQPGVYAAQRAMMEEFNKPSKEVVVIGTIQMYLQDSLDQLKQELDLAKKNNYQVGLKLVRGAYIHSEPDRMNTIHVDKQSTDNCYNEGVSIMLDDIFEAEKTLSAPVVGKLIVATHNEHSCALVDQRLQNAAAGLGTLQATNLSNRVVFGQLMGMADDQSHELASRGHHVVKYVPWGPAQETKEYLVRRLEENGDAAREGGIKYAKFGVQELFSRLRSKQTA
ncbi:proline dehydrogenase [Sugiyamaella lignohabitans]|uniref:Proline dehydrogenase n=1 Tax=Sugiyamaella lignohabitans TaxID=796027 RepID=A0A167E1D7_9ASCO|nr:proline dehydrogenase [Sugiyamaella lignohabitans]ANB13531.1 proline dehydrogenase [Sugiyamaella lignohabitans]